MVKIQQPVTGWPLRAVGRQGNRWFGYAALTRADKKIDVVPSLVFLIQVSPIRCFMLHLPYNAPIDHSKGALGWSSRFTGMRTIGRGKNKHYRNSIPIYHSIRLVSFCSHRTA